MKSKLSGKMIDKKWSYYKKVDQVKEEGRNRDRVNAF
jgi:hypothetical protein